MGDETKTRQELLLEVKALRERAETAEARCETVTHALRKGEHRMRQAADAMPQIVWTLDLEGGVTYANQQWTRYTGMTLEETLGDGWRTAFHPEDFPALLAAAEKAWAIGQDLELVYRLRRFDGVYRWHLGRSVCQYREDGRLQGRVGTITDIDDRIQAEQAMRRQQAELEVSNERLRELDRLKSAFISAASHELRTPLVSVLGYAEFLSDEIGGVLSPEQRGFVEQIAKSAQRLKSLVNDLLDLAQLEAHTFRLVTKPFDLGETVNNEVTSLRPQATERQLELTVTRPLEPLEIEGDPLRIAQVLINLVANAIKFTKPGGRVNVALDPVPEGVRVAVQDTGIGIAPEHLGRLAERFYQVDLSLTRAHGGTGLGLSITKALIEAHGATLAVASTPGQGSTFSFVLPRCARSAPPETLSGDDAG